MTLRRVGTYDDISRAITHLPSLENRSPFAGSVDVSFDRDGRVCLVVVVAGRFDLPEPGATRSPALRLSEPQEPPNFQDVFFGDPASSSLRREGQSAYTRPGTDIHLLGRAWAPRGRRCKESTVALSVGPCAVQARISGPRRYVRAALGVTATAVEPLESVELRYEHSVGGPTEPRNPVGCGIYAGTREAVDQPLPQIEDPRDRGAPIGFGPIARAWQPRLGYAGTYDQAWIDHRAPRWPEDLDLRFFQAAPPALVATPHLRGGEPVQVVGCHPDGPWRFTLPTHRLRARWLFTRAPARTTELTLDAVEIDAEAFVVTLIWRASVALAGPVFDHQVTFLDEMHPGEAA